jgi:hypothetical protein
MTCSARAALGIEVLMDWATIQRAEVAAFSPYSVIAQFLVETQ